MMPNDPFRGKFRTVPLEKMHPQTLDLFVVPNEGGLVGDLIEFGQRFYEGIPDPFCTLKHAGAVNDWPSGIQSTGRKGLHVIDDIAAHYPNAIILRLEGLMGERASGVRNQIRGDMLEACQHGIEYDYVSVLGFQMRLFGTLVRWYMTKRCPDYPELFQFCSEAYVRAVRKRHMRILGMMQPDYISPGLLAMQPEFAYVGRACDFPVVAEEEISGDLAFFGKLCWAGESGQNMDSKIARSRVLRATAELLEKARWFGVERIQRHGLQFNDNLR